jgi:asparagine synthase (glutamine-hydrolysing)
MCGIAGVLNLDGAPVDPAVVGRMLEVQRHRGPDDRGVRLFSLASGESLELSPPESPSPRPGFDAALAFNRLAILDLSAHGHQPMVSADGRVFIVFNGEIYNAFGFRSELEAAGFRFRSRSDTEVLLYLYERYGLDGMLARVNGMFAIAIADLRTREVHLARDPFGVKPLYWTQAGRTLMFASEPKAFLNHPAFAPRLDAGRFDEYLAFRYCADDRHLLAGVQQLRPGHCMRVTADGFTIRRYRAIPDPPRAATNPSDAHERLEALLRAGVKSQLLADVKVGCQLSGGIDSSLVAAHARADLGAPMESFSIVFDDARFSEAHWIDEAVRATGLVSHRHAFTADDFFATLEPATWHMDQPISHPNALGIYKLAEMARRSVTVLLSGEGADEVFGGYPRHYYASLRPQMLPWLPLLSALPVFGERFARNFGRDSADPAAAFIAASMFMQPAEIRELRPEFDAARAIASRRPTFDEGRGDHLANCLAYDMQTYMADLLVRQDKMTMAHSVENRVPYLDVPLVDFARSLPAPMLVGDRVTFPPSKMRNTKKPLKALAERRFGAAFAYRSKSGFGLPLADYYADARFEQLMRERLLPGMRSRGLVRAEAVERKWRAGVDGGAGNVEGLWAPVAFELWAQRFLDGRGQPPRGQD